ncbi:MAG: outer membrane beta-barrel protein [Acidobacteriota bacterium]
MLLRRLIAAMLAAGVSVLPANAADPPLHPDLDTGDLRRAGPFYYRPYLLLKALGYDDNVFFDGAEPVADVTAALAPGIDLLLRTGPRGGLRVNQEFDYVAFAEYSGENHWNSHTEVRGIYVPKYFRLVLDGQYHTVRERPNLEINERIRQDTTLLQAMIGSPADRRLGIEMQLGRETFRYTEGAYYEITRRRLSRDQDTLSLTGTVRLLPKTYLVVTGSLLNADYVYPEERRDSRFDSAVVGLRFAPTARIQGHFEVGPARFHALDRENDDYRSYVGEVELSGRIGRANRLSAWFRRGIDASALEDNLFFLSRRGSLGYERFFTPRVSLALEVGDGANRYPNRTLLREPEPRVGTRVDRIREYEGMVYYRFRDGLTLNVGVTHLEVDSTDDALDRRQNLVAVGTTALF